MEAGTAEAYMPQHMKALATAQRRKVEIGQLKRDIKSGRLTAAQALDDPRAQTAVTVGQILIAQPNWGRRKTAKFIMRLGAPAVIWTKPIGKLTDRQRAVIARGLVAPSERLGISIAW